MQNLYLPLIRLDVVAEILIILRTISDECGEQYSMVHGNLAVAKLGLQIQAEKALKYENSFIHIGPFHFALINFASHLFLIGGISWTTDSY